MITTNLLEKIARRFGSRRQRGGGEACEGWDEAVLGGPQPRLPWHQEVRVAMVFPFEVLIFTAVTKVR
ncbi:hypothetical protein TanjilG_00227 [Lupinus angustifolius]|uniref:Uncharacterized protein n=1 Tax=Lupinus angustifolius TaxID=3871 RepID=A0A394D2G6_LUPAN|nr:hypothetical protein TanjilG_00227 [Lupinus angustifolius]